MSPWISSGVAALVIVASAGPAGAQGQSGQAQAGQRRSSSEVVTLIGCVELESDYRKRVGAGRGGVLGTGVEAGDEYVLTNVKLAADAERGAAPPAAVYSVTGRLEKDLKRSIARQVEVVGFVENTRSAGDDPKDVAELPRINVNVWHPVADFCPAK